MEKIYPVYSSHNFCGNDSASCIMYKWISYLFTWIIRNDRLDSLVFYSICFKPFIFHAVTQIPVILKQIRVNKEKKKRIEKQIFIYKQYQEQNILLRRQNHDMNNHLQALSFLLSQNRIDDMKKYIKELLKE
mgnify:CR=1 FL=1